MAFFDLYSTFLLPISSLTLSLSLTLYLFFFLYICDCPYLQSKLSHAITFFSSHHIFLSCIPMLLLFPPWGSWHHPGMRLYLIRLNYRWSDRLIYPAAIWANTTAIAHLSCWWLYHRWWNLMQSFMYTDVRQKHIRLFRLHAQIKCWLRYWSFSGEISSYTVYTGFIIWSWY